MDQKIEGQMGKYDLWKGCRKMSEAVEAYTCSGNEKWMCPVEYTLSLVGGKYKTVILWHLMNQEVLRYGEIKKRLPGITHKTLSNQLKEMEQDGIVHREEYHQIPPKVEYSLTEKGRTLGPVLSALCEWGRTYMND